MWFDTRLANELANEIGKEIAKNGMEYNLRETSQTDHAQHPRRRLNVVAAIIRRLPGRKSVQTPAANIQHRTA